MIGQSERGLVVAGETGSPLDPAPVQALARAAGWPVIAEPQSGARTGDLVVSTVDALLRHEPFAHSHRPDVVLRIGRVATSKPLLAFLGPDVRQILVDPDAAWIDPERTIAHAIDADPAMLCAEVAKAATPRTDS